MSHKKGTHSVFGIFDNREKLETTVANLKAAGYRNSDISALMPAVNGAPEMATHKDTKAPEGATAGGVSGALLGGTLGWLVGLGALAIPGIGPFVAAGPIMAALAGAGLGGAVGGVTGSLIGLGMPEYEAKRYEESIRKGSMLLSVHVDDNEWQEKAENILKNGGARDISSSREESVESRQDKRTNEQRPTV